MPEYGDNKRRSIAKSILPSTRRRFAHDERRAIHRAARHADRQQIRSFLDDWEDYDGSVGERYTTNGRRERSEIRYMMYERRAGDKLGPAMRWGASWITTIPNPHQRLPELRRVFGQNLIGRHIITHLKDLSGIPEENPWSWRHDLLRHDPTWDAWFLDRDVIRTRQFALSFTMAELVGAALHKVCGAGQLGRFNDHLRTKLNGYQRTYRNSTRDAWVVEVSVPIRLLNGHADVAAFFEESGIRTTEAVFQAVLSYFPVLKSSTWDWRTKSEIPMIIELP